MKERKTVWLTLGIGLMVVGFLLLDRIALLGIVLFLVGMGILILLSIRFMGISGRVKDNYFDRGQIPGQKFSPVSEEVPENIWDRLTKKKGETQ